MQITNLKLQFKMGAGDFSVSVVDGTTVFSALNYNKNLGRFVASKVQDAPTLKKLEAVMGDFEKAIVKRAGKPVTAKAAKPAPATKGKPGRKPKAS